MVKQTAGRDQLGAFAPKFAELNDDVLFGEVWNREEKLSLRDRSLVTVVSLMAQGLVDSSFQFHLISAKNNGITKEEISEILTQICCSPLESQTTDLRSILSDRATLRRFLRNRLVYSTLHLNRAAATIGTFITHPRAADKFWSALADEASIRNGARKCKRLIPATL